MSSNTVTSRSIYPWWRRVLRRAAGEIPALRSAETWWFAAGGAYAPYTLDSSRVDYPLARQLYRNTHDRYKLGGAFARPVINTTAGFMGVPAFSHPDPEAKAALADVAGRWAGRMLRINRNTLRDGDCFARIAYTPHPYSPAKKQWELLLIPPEWVLPILDPMTGRIASVVIRRPVRITDANGSETASYTITETIDAAKVSIEVAGQAPEAVRAQAGVRDNPWGFVPIIHFKNEAEENQLYGASDLEPIEPFMRAYHDTMLHAIQGSKLFSTPRVKFKVKNIDKFMRDNFTADELRNKAIRFANKEIYFVADGEDVAFISADSGAAGAATLLELIYCNIVDVSETPEFAFGTAVASSKASVSEQMVPLARKVERKRGQFSEHYGNLASMFLAMWEKVEARSLDEYQVDVKWPEVSERDDARMATVVNTLVTAMVTGIEGHVISLEAAVETLREYLPAMQRLEDEHSDSDELRRLEATRLILARLADAQGFGSSGNGTGGEPGQVESLADQLRQMRQRQRQGIAAPLNQRREDVGATVQ